MAMTRARNRLVQNPESPERLFQIAKVMIASIIRILSRSSPSVSNEILVRQRCPRIRPTDPTHSAHSTSTRQTHQNAHQAAEPSRFLFEAGAMHNPNAQGSCIKKGSIGHDRTCEDIETIHPEEIKSNQVRRLELLALLILVIFSRSRRWVNRFRLASRH